MEEANALSIRRLSKAYPDFKIDDISFDVPKDMIVGFVGENGAGKTTTINCILGDIFPDSGSIRMFGEEVATSDQSYVGDAEFAKLRQDVGAVFDACSFPNEFSISKVRNTCSYAFERWDDDYFQALSEEFHLTPEKEVKSLSRGMGMKLSLACALAHHPKLLILDEATAGLDPIARDEVLDLIRRAVERERCSVLMSSHITSDLEKCADLIICIHDGKIVFDMPIVDITDAMGIALCTKGLLETLQKSNAFSPDELRIVREPHCSKVLVPDRVAFEEAFPEIPVDRATIDEFMAFVLKGDAL